ncbi:hypothetical protein CYMTET_33872 [Cymbomonas tetramitiformis]|uniref:RNA-binding protein n=1 Tax=Cymbomonas tetramitiformis TaxID=36881 RepID=A0AAE0KQI6_9CHLO|nr:hypothetical protein CYMTET_33872 [Cymbomonas tetramitiformis]
MLRRVSFPIRWGRVSTLQSGSAKKRILLCRPKPPSCVSSFSSSNEEKDLARSKGLTVDQHRAILASEAAHRELQRAKHAWKAEKVEELRKAKKEKERAEEERVQAEAKPDPRRIFVSGFSPEINWKTLKSHFQRVGPVLYTVVHHYTESDPVEEYRIGESKCCGIVQFESELDAAQALSELDQSDFEGSVIRIQKDKHPARPAPQKRTSTANVEPKAPPNSARLFVSGLSSETEWTDLKDHFQQIGTVAYADVYRYTSKSVYIPEGGLGESKGCGVVELVNEIDAKEALFQMHESELAGSCISVKWDKRPDKVWDGRQTRPSHLERDLSPSRSVRKEYPAGSSRQQKVQRHKDERPDEAKSMEPREGDWECPRCGVNVFASRAKCFKCGAKPKTVVHTAARGRFSSSRPGESAPKKARWKHGRHARRSQAFQRSHDDTNTES